MEYKLITTKQATKDINTTSSHISKKLCNIEAADKLLLKIQDCFDKIINNPKLYPKSDLSYKTDYDYRKAVIDNFIILYFINNDKIYIYRFIYNKINYTINQNVSMLKEDTFEYSTV